jgi:hypothetical protein
MKRKRVNIEWSCTEMEKVKVNSIQFNSILLMFHNICNRPGLTGKVTSQIKSCTSHCTFVIKYKQISMKLDTHYIYTFFFLKDPIYLQSVIIHSANGGKGVACRRVLEDVYINSNHQSITSIKHTLYTDSNTSLNMAIYGGHFIKMILSPLKI